MQHLSMLQLQTLAGVPLLPPVLRYGRDRRHLPLPSHGASWRDICQTSVDHHEHVKTAVIGWPDRWRIAFTTNGTATEVSVRDVNPIDLLDADPSRRATWHARTRARAGLHYLSSTGRLHWHESLFERDLLTVLDFDPDFNDVASQPFTLTWHDGTKWKRHTPDFTAVIGGELWVLNVRPEPLMNPALLANAAAIRAMCALRGWREAVIVGYARPALTVLTTLAAARRTTDPQGLGEQMLQLLTHAGPMRFGQLVSGTAAPALARAVLQRLIWDRVVTLDLQHTLTDESLLSLVPEVTA